jgi:hypothetical protein
MAVNASGPNNASSMSCWAFMLPVIAFRDAWGACELPRTRKMYRAEVAERPFRWARFTTLSSRRSQARCFLLPRSSLMQ